MVKVEDIEEWKKQVHWDEDLQVEQDLLLSRIIVEIFQKQELMDKLAFRGGTALYKVHFPAMRYSEDIDLVQISPEPIGETFSMLRERLNPWLGEPRYKLKQERANLYYRVKSAVNGAEEIRIKLEINTNEHYSELGHVELPFGFENSWFSGNAMVKTYQINEILGSKLKALFQRRKGRDLFDIWYALSQEVVDTDALLRCFGRYMREDGRSVSRKRFEMNLLEKSKNEEFQNEVLPLFPIGYEWDFDAALELVLENLISKIPE